MAYDFNEIFLLLYGKTLSQGWLKGIFQKPPIKLKFFENPYS